MKLSFNKTVTFNFDKEDLTKAGKPVA